MQAVVVYESMFGNTEQIARSIATGLGEHLDVSVVEVGNAPELLPEEVSLLVVGGPTHAFGMTRPSTRKSAREQKGGAVVSNVRGIREWLQGLENPSSPVAAVAFDTRVKVRFMPGSAARGARRILAKRGFRTNQPAQTFWVEGTPGPLKEGEIERARAWGEALAGKTSKAST